LEEPGPDERPIVVSIEPPPREIVARIIESLKALSRQSGPESSR
jgi:hypothetical protein